MSMDLFNPNKEALLAKWADMIRACREISPWTSDIELAWLAEGASGRQIVGEVGSYKGKSAKALAWQNHYVGTPDWKGPVKVHCFDRFQDHTEEACRQNLHAEIGFGFVDLLPVESEQGAAIIARTSIRFDLFFIDASHEKHDVLRDIGLWKPLVKPGGILCGHDYCPWDGERNGVSLAVREALPGHCNPVDSIWAIVV